MKFSNIILTISALIALSKSKGQGQDSFSSIIKKHGIDSAYRLYDSVLQKNACVTLFCEDTMNRLGYEFLRENKVKDALIAFKMNTLAYPASHNVYDSYAEALNISGATDSAALNYFKSLQVFPNSWTAYRGLKNMGHAPSSDTMAKLIKTIIPNDISYLPNIIYGKGGTKNLKLSIIREATSSPYPQPVLVYLHGGGWQEGIKETGLVPSIHFARRGYVCIVVEYRLSSEAIFPAQIEDVKCAIRYLRAHAETLNINPKKIGVWGESAGGYLAMMLGVTSGIKPLEGKGGWDAYSSNVQAVCEWSAATSFIDSTIKGTPSVPIDAVYRLFGGNPYEKRHLVSLATPFHYIDNKDSPFLIFHGENDNIVKKEHAENLFRALIAVGVRASIRIFPNEGHFASYGATVGEISGGMPAIRSEMRRLMNEFFDKHLKQ
jgi:acetyl esterase/lipase